MEKLVLVFSIIQLSGSYNAIGGERSTPIVFSTQDASKFQFDTNYSLPSNESDTFLLGVMKQRSLGTFRKTSVTQTDDFAAAIGKRLDEYAEISGDLRAGLDDPLPGVTPPTLKLVKLGGEGKADASKMVKNPWEYSKDSVNLKVAEIATELEGGSRAKGMRMFFSLDAFLDSNPGAPYLETARTRMKELEQAHFSNGVLRDSTLSDLSALLNPGSSKGAFIRNLLNQCITNPNCNATAARVLVANVDLFATTSELRGIGIQLQQIEYKLQDFDQALAIIAKLYALEKFQVCGDVDCTESKAYYVQNLTKAYGVGEDVAKICSDNIFKKRDQQ